MTSTSTLEELTIDQLCKPGEEDYVCVQRLKRPYWCPWVRNVSVHFKQSNELTCNELFSLSYYTLASNHINRALYSNGNMTQFQMAITVELSKALRKIQHHQRSGVHVACNNYNFYNTKTMSLAHSTFNQHYAALHVGDQLSQPGFLSTTKDAKIAENFIKQMKKYKHNQNESMIDVLLTVESVDGVDIDYISLYGSKLCAVSKFMNVTKCERAEQEILIPPGQFNVTNITKYDGIFKISISQLTTKHFCVTDQFHAETNKLMNYVYTEQKEEQSSTNSNELLSMNGFPIYRRSHHSVRSKLVKAT